MSGMIAETIKLEKDYARQWVSQPRAKKLEIFIALGTVGYLGFAAWVLTGGERLGLVQLPEGEMTDTFFEFGRDEGGRTLADLSEVEGGFVVGAVVLLTLALLVCRSHTYGKYRAQYAESSPSHLEVFKYAVNSEETLLGTFGMGASLALTKFPILTVAVPMLLMKFVEERPIADFSYLLMLSVSLAAVQILSCARDKVWGEAIGRMKAESKDDLSVSGDSDSPRSSTSSGSISSENSGNSKNTVS